MHEYTKPHAVSCRIYDHFYRQVSFKKHLYLYGVHYICRLYIYFPVSGYLSALQASEKLSVLQILFLGTFDKKRRKKKALYTMTTLETSHHNLILTWLLQYSQYIYVIYFCIAENLFIWSVYWFIQTQTFQRVYRSWRRLETFQRLFMLLFVHSCHLPFKVILWITDLLPHDHCGKNKTWMEDDIFYIFFFIHSITLPKLHCDSLTLLKPPQ